MTRQKRKRHRPAPQPNASVAGEHEYSHGYVLVHGIGPTTSGSTLNSIARPAATLLADIYGDNAQWRDRTPIAGQKAAVLDLSIDGKRESRVLFVESRWTELTEIRRFSLAAVWWTVLSTLTLTPYVIGPGAKELREAERQLQGWDEDRLPSLRHAPVFASVLGAMLWRLSVLGVVVALVWQLFVIGVVGLIVGAILTAGALVWLARSQTDFAGQVRAVATHAHIRHRVLESIAQTVAAAERQCDGVTLIGHSQGGYLAYELLRTRGLTQLSKTRDLIGIGSGLKPIRILASMRGNRAIGGTIVFAAGAALTLSAAALAARQTDFSSWPALANQDTVAWMEAVSTFLMESWLSELPYYIVMLMGLAVAGLGVRIRRQFTRKILDVPDLTITRWEEWSTAHDIVGRLALPSLPARTRTRYVAGSHTLIDHLLTSYFRVGGDSRMFLAERIINQSHVPVATKRRWTQIVNAQNAASLSHATRWYGYRGYVQLCVFVAIVLLPSLLSGNADMLGRFWQTWWVFLVTGAISAGVGWLVVRRYSRATQELAIQQLSRSARGALPWWPAPPKDGWYWLRIGALLVVFGLGAFTLLAAATVTADSRGFGTALLILLAYLFVLGTYFSAVAADLPVPAWLSIVLTVTSFVLGVGTAVLAGISGAASTGEWVGISTFSAMSTIQLFFDVPLAFVRRHQRSSARDDHIRRAGRAR